MTVEHPSKAVSYSVTVGSGLLEQASSYFNLDRKVLVITDEGVPTQYAGAILKCCSQAELLVLPQGECAKSTGSLELIWETMLEAGFDRSDAIVAVGGGVVGDVAGFAAACYMRGIDYYNVPTTLLSQVDSSVGGKTAINFLGVKNIVGAFRAPAGVLADTSVLSTLSPRLFSEGMAEVIKMAATGSPSLFRKLEECVDVHPIMSEVITSALEYKLDVVSRDYSEKGLRSVLNFGHTIGHALEAASAGSLYHGEAVAIGMMYTSSGQARRRIEALLRKFNLPVKDAYSAADLMQYVRRDKKRRGSLTKLVCVNEIGTYEFRELSDEALLDLIQSHKNEE